MRMKRRETRWLDRATQVMTYCGQGHAGRHGRVYFDIAGTDRRDTSRLVPSRCKMRRLRRRTGVAALVLGAPERSHRQVGVARATRSPSCRVRRQAARDSRFVRVHVAAGAVDGRCTDHAIEVAGPSGEGPACAMHLARTPKRTGPRKVVVRKIADRPAATVCVAGRRGRCPSPRRSSWRSCWSR